MITLWEIFALGCLLPFGDGRPEHIPPPDNVSLSWVDLFCYKISWNPVVKDQQPCMYNLSGSFLPDPWRYEYAAMEGGELSLDLSAVCGGKHSAQLHLSITYPELVKDFKCALRFETSVTCTWIPAKHVANLGLYYWMGQIKDKTTNDNCTTALDVEECPDYQSDGTAAKRACALQGGLHSRFYFLFNGTVNGTLARNTFYRLPFKNMQRAALNWTGVVVGNKLIISWTPITTGFKSSWKYILTYAKCGAEPTHEEYRYPLDQVELWLGNCQHNVSMKAVQNRSGFHGRTEPGVHRLYGENTNPLGMAIMASVLILATLAVVLLVAIVCFRRHRQKLLPHVPEPQWALPDMLRPTNGSIPGSLYVMALKEDPQEDVLEIRPEYR